MDLEYGNYRDNFDLDMPMSAKFFRRGQREYFMIAPGIGMKIINKEFVSYITIAHDESPGLVIFLMGDIEEAKEITKDEFKKQFEEASRLIVLEE